MFHTRTGTSKKLSIHQSDTEPKHSDPADDAVSVESIVWIAGILSMIRFAHLKASPFIGEVEFLKTSRTRLAEAEGVSCH